MHRESDWEGLHREVTALSRRIFIHGLNKQSTHSDTTQNYYLYQQQKTSCVKNHKKNVIQYSRDYCLVSEKMSIPGWSPDATTSEFPSEWDFFTYKVILFTNNTWFWVLTIKTRLNKAKRFAKQLRSDVIIALASSFTGILLKKLIFFPFTRWLEIFSGLFLVQIFRELNFRGKCDLSLEKIFEFGEKRRKKVILNSFLAKPLKTVLSFCYGALAFSLVSKKAQMTSNEIVHT